MTEPIRVLSWGMGTQSTTLAVLSALGEFNLPKIDSIMVADLGWERQATYQIRDWFIPWFEDHDIPVTIIKTADIRHDGAKAHVHIPFFTQDGGPLQRQCTQGFKIRPLRRAFRELLGYPPSNPPHPPAGAGESWLGISLEEYTRMKSSGVDWCTNRYPLVELRLTRWDCIDWLRDHDFPIPVKSACVCCPYRSNPEWLQMQQETPEEFEEAARFDEENRHNPLKCNNTSTEALYLHRDLQPLRDVDFASKPNPEDRQWQAPLFLPCDGGYCNV